MPSFVPLPLSEPPHAAVTPAPAATSRAVWTNRLRDRSTFVLLLFDVIGDRGRFTRVPAVLCLGRGSARAQERRAGGRPVRAPVRAAPGGRGPAVEPGPALRAVVSQGVRHECFPSPEPPTASGSLLPFAQEVLVQ
ncbi:hypothetical protein GCM10010094_81850 [Streptomyces flaveus]|uniref:Uncharacterized protein n=1 Tax=Streptomyces flaveus TaxID=66370 RepID=A0A917RIJ5_9ACTN|nr:hypothetical protein GCM10010094_81850 [Streptomyces flaveus]